jgi:cytochrome c2
MKRAAVLFLFALAACSKPEAPAPQQQAKPAAPATPAPARGQQLITQYGCNACHTIPGIEGAQGMLAPSLEHVATRPAISNGKVQNTPANLQRFIQNPPSMNPASGMPPLAIADTDARDIVAYLETLR